MTSQDALVLNGAPANTLAGDPLEYISPSRLKSFFTCRLRFFFERVLGLRFPSSPNLQIGKAVHAGLEYFNTTRWRGDAPTQEQVQAAYIKAYGELEDEDPVDYGSKDRQACIDTGERLINAFLKSDIARDPRRVRAVEVYLRREAGVLPLPLVGVLDLVVEGSIPTDYKTIGSTPNLAEEAWQHDLQLTAYHLLLLDATGESPGPAELIYLVKLKSPKVIRQELPPITPIQIDRLKALCDVYVDGVEREQYYPSAGMHCRWCNFRNRCGSWPQFAEAA